jgi:hypothetical protein
MIGMPAPAHLSVVGWKLCVGQKDVGTAKYVCFPAAKPDECTLSAWDQLSKLTNGPGPCNDKQVTSPSASSTTSSTENIKAVVNNEPVEDNNQFDIIGKQGEYDLSPVYKLYYFWIRFLIQSNFNTNSQEQKGRAPNRLQWAKL